MNLDCRALVAYFVYEDDRNVLAEFGSVRLLSCPCTMLIVDMKTLLTVSSWAEENSRAILTQDLGLVTVSQEYYSNPRCCIETA